MRTNIIGGQAETMDIREETGVVVEAIIIHPTPHTSKTDSIPVNRYGHT